MPLPDGLNLPWPPKELEQVNNKIASWSAWYSGDPDMLSAVYGGQVAGDTTGFFASERGGWRAAAGRALRRFFWGTRSPNSTEPQSKLHVPLAGDIAAASADLLFSEPPTITVDDDATQKAIDELIDDGVHATLLEGAEIAAALGGVFLRIVWDTTLREHPWIMAVHADAAVPEWAWGELSAVTFWRIIADDGQEVIRHLERHEPGKILHGVYRGDSDHLGPAAPLADFPETKNLKPALDTGTKRLTAVYVPNMRPNRIWRNKPAAAYLGRSDYAGTEQLMDALDETYSSLMRDIELGKARLVVPSTYLMKLGGAGEGAGFDGERKLYEGVGGVMGNANAGMTIEQVQFDIRIAEHEQSALNLMNRIISGAGYAAQTFGLTDTVAVTATEVAAKERRSFITRDRKICYWRPQIAAIVETLLEIYAEQFDADITPQLPKVEFGDTVSQDPEAQAQTLQLLEAARAASTETKVRTLHPDWDDTQVDEEVDKIDKMGALQDPGTFTGGPPGDTGGTADTFGVGKNRSESKADSYSR